MKQSILFVAVLVTLGLGACSRSDVTLDATAQLAGGGAPEAKTTLKLSGFGKDDATSGEGTLTIENVPGRPRTAPTGTYAVTWQRSAGPTLFRNFTVAVPTAHAGLSFTAMPTTNGITGDARVYWCLTCERFEDGVGDLISLPGVYAKQD